MIDQIKPCERRTQYSSANLELATNLAEEASLVAKILNSDVIMLWLFTPEEIFHASNHDKISIISF